MEEFRIKKIRHHQTLMPEILFWLTKSERLNLLHQVSKGARVYSVKCYPLISMSHPIMRSVIRNKHRVAGEVDLAPKASFRFLVRSEIDGVIVAAQTVLNKTILESFDSDLHKISQATIDKAISCGVLIGQHLYLAMRSNHPKILKYRRDSLEQVRELSLGNLPKEILTMSSFQGQYILCGC